MIDTALTPRAADTDAARRDAHGDARPFRWQLSLALFICCLSTFLLFFNGRLGIVDGELMYRVTESLVERRSVDIPAHEYAAKGRDGRYYSKYGPLQSVLAAPLYVVGRAAAAHSGGVSGDQVKRAAVALFNPVLLAALTVAVFHLGLLLEFSPRRALAGALLSTFATPFWFLSKTFNSEPLTALCLVLCFIALVRYRSSRGEAELAVAGLCLGLAVLTRPVAAAAAPLILLYLWGSGCRRLSQYVAFGAALSLGILLLAGYNALRFGNPLESGYLGERFTTPLWIGIPGLLISPRCGVLFYAPALLLALPGFRTLARRHRREAWLAAGFGAVWLVLSGAWWCWWGGWAVGPRLLLPVVPLLAVPAAAALPAARTLRPVGRAVLIAAGLLAVAQQAVPLIAAHPEWKQIELQTEQRGDDAMWDFRYMPLVWQAREAARVIRMTPQLTGNPRPSRPAADAAGSSAMDVPVVDSWSCYLILLGKSALLSVAGLLLLLVAVALGGGRLLYLTRRPALG